MEFIEFKASLRDRFGTSNARRLRKQKKILATIYSKNAPPIHITLDGAYVKKNLKPHHHFYFLKVDSTEYKVFLKSIQKDHLGSSIYHIDFEIVEPAKLFEIKIPIKYVGQPKGVVTGGHTEYIVHEIIIASSIDNIIEEITVDISHLDIGDRLKISDLQLPKGVTVKSPPPNTVMVIIRKAVVEEVKPAEIAAPAAQTATATTEPASQPVAAAPQEKKEPEKKSKTTRE